MAELNVSRKNIEGLLSLNDPSTKGKILSFQSTNVLTDGKLKLAMCFGMI